MTIQWLFHSTGDNWKASNNSRDKNWFQTLFRINLSRQARRLRRLVLESNSWIKHKTKIVKSAFMNFKLHYSANNGGKSQNAKSNGASTLKFHSSPSFFFFLCVPFVSSFLNKSRPLGLGYITTMLSYLDVLFITCSTISLFAPLLSLSAESLSVSSIARVHYLHVLCIHSFYCNCGSITF